MRSPTFLLRVYLQILYMILHFLHFHNEKFEDNIESDVALRFLVSGFELCSRDRRVSSIFSMA